MSKPKRKSKQSKANKAEQEVQTPSSPLAEVVSISSKRLSHEPLETQETPVPEEEVATPEEKPIASESEVATPGETIEEKPEVQPETEPTVSVAESPKPARPTRPAPPPPASEVPSTSKSPTSLTSGIRKGGPSRGSRGSGLPRPKKVVPITQCGEFNAGDTVTLPYSGKSVTLTNFYQGSSSGDWWAAFEGGCVQVKALKRVSV